MNISNVENDINNLGKSPIYSISLCSLENFHTCFWKWIGQNYPKDFLKVFVDKIYPSTVIVEYSTQIQYGKDAKVDLQVKITDKNKVEFIFIENKLKSFPTDKQLIKYSDRLKDKSATFILLSLAPKLDLPPEWLYQSYLDLANRMKNIFDGNFVYHNPYHKFLIEDYIGTIESIAKKFPTNNSKKYDFYSKNQLDEIGLKDIYIKYKTSELSSMIEKQLNCEKLYIGSGFNNKKGTLDIVKDCAISQFNIGIQIEGNQYRYYINALYNDESDNSNKVRENLATELFEKGFWFHSTTPTSRARIYKTFCGYKPGFIYRYLTLESLFNKENLKDVTYEEIAAFVKNDIDQLHSNLPQILEIAEKHIQGYKP